MQIIDRIGIDIGIKKSVEDGLLWAAAHGLHYVDFRLDTSPDAFVAFTSERCEAIRTRAEADGITIGLHTLSAVNIAEYSPYLGRPPITICAPISISLRPSMRAGSMSMPAIISPAIWRSAKWQAWSA